MSHFYGRIQGSRGEATRCGTKSSGLTVSANGWNIGASITLSYDDETGLDTIRIIINKGSNDSSAIEIIERNEGNTQKGE